MYRTLSDLRILQLAVHLEDTLERYEDFLRSSIVEVPVRARLNPIFQEGPAHHRLRAARDRVARAAAQIKDEFETDTVLQAILECERIARDFYRSQMDHLSNPELVEIFRSMANEEEQHAEVVRQALHLLVDVHNR